MNAWYRMYSVKTATSTDCLMSPIVETVFFSTLRLLFCLLFLQNLVPIPLLDHTTEHSEHSQFNYGNLIFI